MESKCNNCKLCKTNKHRTEEEKVKLIKRLNVINGQVNGLKQMLEDGRMCEDILIQISAINKSLKSIGNEILKGHLSTCIIEELKNENTDVVEKIVDLFEKLNK